MRINKYLASGSNLSRRKADEVIAAGRVTINGKTADLGSTVEQGDDVRLDNGAITPAVNTTTIMLNKPVDYVCSRAGQGSQTIYDLLPSEYQSLNPVGRLDKNSSGLLLLTNDGTLAHELTHPSRQKIKVYEVVLDQPLQPLHRQMLSDHGVTLADGPSKFELERLVESDDTQWKVIMSEGRNRQIRRTFAALGYEVTALHRTHFGPYALGDLASGTTQTVATKP
jgi:pseudouridine synthase